MIGEESIKDKDEAYIDGALRGDCWVIDPIDGTVPFAFGFDTWGISIGYMVNGRIVDGAIYLPASRLLIISDGDAVYCGFGTHADKIDMAPLERRAVYSQRGIVSISQDLACRGTVSIPNPVQSVGSCVYSAGYYLYGSYANVITNVKLWDIAGSIALMEKAGHTVLLTDGSEVRGATTLSSFLVAPQDNPHRRWAMTGHIFIGLTRVDCQGLIDITTI